ncbi:2584_t:CDS:1, partial [Ambispora gerdemannii]
SETDNEDLYEQIIIWSEEKPEINEQEDRKLENDKMADNKNLDINNVLIVIQQLAQAITNQNEWPMEKMIIPIR